MNEKLKKWVGFNFDRNKSFDNPPREGTDESDEAKQFFKDLKSDLGKILKNKEIKLHRMKPNYYDISACVTDGYGKFAYISFGDIRFKAHWEEQVLVRTMKNEKDWTGGGNTFVSYDKIPEQILWLWR